jgi:predicted O-methyltransferase YrrM
MTATPNFTQDWFGRSIPAWSRILTELQKERPPLRVLEVGVFEGRSTCWLLENFCKTPDSLIVAVDSFAGGIEHQGMQLGSLQAVFESNIASVASQGRVEICQGDSLDQLAKLIAAGIEPFDFVSIDASHQAPDVLADALLGFRLLRPGCVMALDDYLWNPYRSGSSNPLLLPKIAVDAFTTIFSNKCRIIPNLPLYQLYVQKNR